MRRVELQEQTEDFVRKNSDVSVTLFQVSPSKVREERPPPRPCSFDSIRQSPTLAVLKRDQRFDEILSSWIFLHVRGAEQEAP